MANTRDIPEYQLEIGEKSLLMDERKFQLLKYIDSLGSITRASKESKIPYRTALKYIEVIEKIVGQAVVLTQRGGKGGGGGSQLTDTGKLIIKEYIKLNQIIKKHSNLNEIEGTVSSLEIENRVMNVKIGQNEILLPLHEDLEKGDKVLILINPEDIFIMLRPQESSVRNIVEGEIVGMEIQNEMVKLKVALDPLTNILVSITRYSWEKMELSLEKKVFVGFKATSLSLIKM
ncbi:MAG TPA: TOBE domain-containing protein [Methanobacteriaceae archaeon]|nr:TOBE domain-containing protein [Methanobacteriaceae archaeon]